MARKKKTAHAVAAVDHPAANAKADGKAAKQIVPEAEASAPAPAFSEQSSATSQMVHNADTDCGAILRMLNRGSVSR